MIAYNYSDQFYAALKKSAKVSAKKVVPLVLELVEPSSIIDVGCGMGSWLSVFVDHGITDIKGIDGDHIDTGNLDISIECFEAVDLSKPFSMSRRFDLAICLEVAEHLPEKSAESFVQSLIELSDTILFSAAIPNQGGDNHVNEQWPEYWAAIFAEKNYKPIDCLRRELWNQKDVSWWFAQNMMFFVHQDVLKKNKTLAFQENATIHNQLSLVHPRKYIEMSWEIKSWKALSELFRHLPGEELVTVIDQGKVISIFGENDRLLTFPNSRSSNWICPPSDNKAIEEMRLAFKLGSNYLAIFWPAFWWLDYYKQFSIFLETETTKIIEIDDLIVRKVRT
jgi:SAM-dependent methyltransferase